MTQAAPAAGFRVERTDDVAWLRMDAGRANAMTADFLTGLAATVAALRADPPPVLVVTGSGRVFSAGLALPDIAGYERGALREFMSLFGRVMESVLTFPAVTVAAVNGHAVAGGCVLALMCDRRLMAEPGGRIGLSEVALGIGLPAIVLESLRARVPAASVTPIALAGELFGPSEALSLGLVDETLAHDTFEPAVTQRARALSGAPEALQQVKRGLLRPLLAQLRDHEGAELEAWLDTWYSPAGRSGVAAAVARMKR